MAKYTWDHIHLRTPDPEATAQWFEKMLGAEITRTMQQGQPRIDMKIGGANVFLAPVKPGDGVSNLEFDVTDGTATVHVVSRGVPPQLFRDRIGVVVEGTMTKDGVFESHRLMVSHDNKYRAPADRNVDIKELMRSTEGLEEPSASGAAVARSPKP